MNKSVSATQLSKMVYCEASVVRKATINDLDRKRIAAGLKAHNQFERRLNGENVHANIDLPLFTKTRKPSSAVSPSMVLANENNKAKSTYRTKNTSESISSVRLLLSTLILLSVVVWQLS